MVLWEITLVTAYFLGLKRTYRLALKLQRRLIGPNHPKIREFLYRRTRSVFSVAIRIHSNIQQRDIEVGRNLGNWILRWLDRMKPSAQIRGLPGNPPSVGNTSKHVTNSSKQQPPGSIQKFSSKIINRGAIGRLTTSSSLHIWPKSFPTLGTMLRPSRPTGANTQYRNLCFSGPYLPGPNYEKGRFDGVIRKDIMQWMLRN
ncbi:uncharacterized protein LOC122646770 isoform X2 [Telopea speciosissima]|uniref:uncharacterized protein LOC122646770 isoform X1 n=1 Tax=Telopea speciosissima TaxID=54955 RepID=UPI001CC75E7C|nr:uncharacterized protein LOC122646770 isoform X1 [Telopea speciosissima]XP_043696304.1 uncharacterized protein LOC122646770 isoform X2 [Telopea speciosissima]